MKKHEGRNDGVKFGKFTRYLSEAEVANQHLKTVICELCNETFPGQQNLDEHKTNVHDGNHQHSCPLCPKVFRKKVQTKTHVRRVHTDPSILCLECGKKSNDQQKHKKHEKVQRNTQERISSLQIKGSKYHGRNFEG